MQGISSVLFSGLLCQTLALAVGYTSLCLFGVSAYGQTVENLALYRPVTVSSVDNYPDIPEFAVDGQPDTRWRSIRSWQQGQVDTLDIDLQGTCLISKIDILWSASADKPVFTEMRTSELSGPEQVTGWARVYNVQVSSDGENWVNIAAITGGAGGLESVTPTVVPARHVRVAVSKRSHDDCSVAISEISVYGTTQEDRPAAEGWPVRRKAKTQVVPATVAGTEQVLPLNTGWELQRADWAGAKPEVISSAAYDTANWYNATVPGTVLTTLVNEQVFPEPTIGRNNLLIPECLSRHKWWYRTELAVPANWLSEKRRLSLDFAGINHCAGIWLNGAKLGTIEGAFIRGCFDITDKLDPAGKNILAVCIFPPANPGVPLEKRDDFWVYNGGAHGKDSPAFLASIGWDWMGPVHDRAMGIWQGVCLRANGPVTIKDPQVITDLPLPQTDSADITIRVPLHNSSEQELTASVSVAFADITLEQSLSVPAGGEAIAKFNPKQFPVLTIHNPQLWWPVGYGGQYLYDLTITAAVAEQTSDSKQLKFGVRELSYRGNELTQGINLPEDAADAPGQMEISVNGQRILCRGGNWGYPEMLLRLSDDRQENAIRLHHEAGLNMVRNWIGMNTNEEFYALCDKYGILIWNDFWLANPSDGPEPCNEDRFLANVTDTICRYRNHPSIAIWCGRNEGMPPASLDSEMRHLTEILDGSRYYQSHSADFGVNGCGPYKSVPVAGYFDKYNRGFKTEMGMPSLPQAATVRRMLDDANPWPIDGRWSYHDFAPQGNQYRDEYIKMIETKFGPATDLDDLCNKAQFVNYDGYRGMFEGANHKLWQDSSGLLLWMSHPAWPGMVWQVYDYWFGTYGAYYGAKKACEMRHVQFCELDNTIEVINHTAAGQDGQVIARIFALDGQLLWEHAQPINAGANARTTAFVLEYPAELPAAWLLNLRWKDDSGAIVSENTYWQGRTDRDLQQLNNMPPVTLLQAVNFGSNQAGETQITVQLTNDTEYIALMTVVTLIDRQTGEPIQPAFYSDNYLTIYPGESQSITIKHNQSIKSHDISVKVQPWNK